MNEREKEFVEAYPGLFVVALRAARRVVVERELAEDIASETLARAYARWSRISSYAAPWVTRVAVNLALDHVRRGPAPTPTPPKPDTDAVDRLALTFELARLPRRQREAVVLRYVLDLDEEAAARVQGVSVPTLRTHTRRGLARMRTDLHDVEGAVR